MGIEPWASGFGFSIRIPAVLRSLGSESPPPPPPGPPVGKGPQGQDNFIDPVPFVLLLASVAMRLDRWEVLWDQYIPSHLLPSLPPLLPLLGSAISSFSVSAGIIN